MFLRQETLKTLYTDKKNEAAKMAGGSFSFALILLLKLLLLMQPAINSDTDSGDNRSRTLNFKVKTSLNGIEPDGNGYFWCLCYDKFTRRNRGLSQRTTFITTHKSTCTTSLQMTLLLISGNVSPNPGPVRSQSAKIPCGKCSKDAKDDCICCYNCDKWYHKSCLEMSTPVFENYCLEKSLVWICPGCSFPSYLQRGFNPSIFSDENYYEVLSQADQTTENDSDDITKETFKPAPNATSTPTSNNRHKRNLARSLKIISVNCNSLRSIDKRAELEALVDLHNPHLFFVKNPNWALISFQVKYSLKVINPFVKTARREEAEFSFWLEMMLNMWRMLTRR